MRDVLTIFLEASAARGAWEAALSAWRTAATAEGAVVSGAHVLLLTRMLAQVGRWGEAVHVVMSGVDSNASVLCHRRVAARRMAMLAAADAGCWSHACQQLQDVFKWQVDRSSGSGDAATERELAFFAEAFERRVVPHIPAPHRATVARVAHELRRGHDIGHNQQQQKQQWRLAVDEADSAGQCAGGAVAVTNNEELLHILHRPKERTSWVRALQVLQSMPHPNAASVNIALGILSRQGRQCEALRVVSVFMVSRGIHPTAVTAKAVAEAANAMRSLDLCKVLIDTPALREQLTPHAAVPLVLTLQRLGYWKLCLEWWDSLLPCDAACSDSGSGSSNGAELRRHLKLSSYVAVCVARGGRWLEALAAMQDAAPHDPPLSVLFALRALRVAGRWEAAVSVFLRSRNVWQHSPVALQVSDVMMRQNAESWVPHATLRALRSACGT
ncbi:hypothetical protein DQ04_02001110 [Trypanosoma grayi]|uniref:hypothetical protein n=1 Tax=Trypanosoma grayi TaxID=71804 RepID=UPI0004F4B887|nr:hypothetical protein DQ04_02001110 [Trypanosoma grayi]KEG12108.1 hypothetical protein DQ04_02001110 [Trypanosoma grayi]